MSQHLDPYRVLQVLPDAEQDEIKVAFRRLARRYHPDRASDAASVARMIEVNRAWELIGDPLKRAAYDRAHGIRSYRPRPAPDADGVGPSMEGTSGTWSGGPQAAEPAAAEPVDPGAAAAASGAGPGGSASGPVNGSDGAFGPAGPPPGRPSGTVLSFGRYEGWSLGEIARIDREYLEWLVRMPIGWQHGDEIRALLQPRPEAARSTAGPTRRSRFFGR